MPTWLAWNGDIHTDLPKNPCGSSVRSDRAASQTMKLELCWSILHRLPCLSALQAYLSCLLKITWDLLGKQKSHRSCYDFTLLYTSWIPISCHISTALDNLEGTQTSFVGWSFLRVSYRKLRVANQSPKMSETCHETLTVSPLSWDIPSGNFTYLWKIATYSEFSHHKWWFPIVM